MLEDCLRVFEKELRAHSEAWLLDNYVPKNGTYVLINMDRNFRQEACVDIAYDGKKGILSGSTHQDFRLIQFLDYYSKLLEMNKPMDPRKVVHSNNLYSFFVKKDSITEKKLTQDVIDGFYDTILHPEKKYKKPKAMELYRQAWEELGEVDSDAVTAIRNWVNLWNQNPELLQDIDMSKKNYLKLFFIYDDREKTKESVRRESRRYCVPNIYNNNDFNEKTEGKIIGLPGNNMGMNAKKPFLGNKTRRLEVPYLIDMDRAILQGQFFDYLWGQASVSKRNIYVDLDKNCIKAYGNYEEADTIDSGLFLRIEKEKNEVKIVESDTIVGYSPKLQPIFEYKDIMDLKPEWEQEIAAGYGIKTTLYEMNLLFDEVFFGKKLIPNYFVEPGDILFRDNQLKNILLTYRKQLFRWFYTGGSACEARIMDDMAMKLVICSMGNGYWNKVKHQMNLMWSLRDYFAQDDRMEVCMNTVKKNLRQHMDNYDEEWDFEGAAEYYYTIGQMVSYFLTLSKAKKKPLSLINSFLNAEDNEQIKEKIIQMFQKYNYDIDSDKNVRVKNLMTHIMMYQPSGEIQKDMIVAGVTDNVLLYQTKERRNQL